MKLLRARAWSAGVAAVLLGAAVGGCSSGHVATVPIVGGLETTNLIVSDFPAIDSAGMYVAVNEGFFQKEGLHVTVVPDFKSSQDTVNMIQSGKAQISSGDYVTYMNNLVEPNPNLEIVAEGSVLQPNVLALMAGPNSKLKSLRELEGKAVPISGVHDIGSLLTDSVLTDNGVPINSVHYVPNIPLPGVPAMIAKGAFTAGPVPEPFVTMGEQQQGDTVLADLDQGATSNFPIVGYAVTPSWAQQNPNTLKAFVTALEEGQQVADTDRRAVEAALEGQPLKVPVNVASTLSLPNFPTGIDSTRLQRVMSNMIEFGFFSDKQLAAAKQFRVKNVVYTANLANANGKTSLLGG